MSSSCTTCPSRRAVLAGAGSLAAAGLLAACSSGGGSSTPQATTGADEPVITDLETLRREGAVAFESADGKALAIAVDDRVVAYSAVCTHDGCTVGWNAEQGRIDCPCHGSQFSVDDGSVLNGPARSPLPEVPVEVDESAGVLRRT